jgi:hypothetical protein
MRKSKEVFFAFTLAIAVNGFAGITSVAQDKKQEESKTNVLRPAIGTAFGAIYGGAPSAVKDVPFSCEMVSETVQILYDGNRIVNRSATVMYRDSQGRTRNEYSFKPLFLGGDNIEHKSINIYDPVSGVSYSLDPQTRTANKFTFSQPADTLNGLALNRVVGTIAPMAITATARYQTRETVASIRFSKGSRLKTAISYLGKQLGLNVVYDDSIKDSQQLDEVNLENVSLAKAVEIILKNNKCSFERVDDSTIRIKAENPAGSQNSESFESFYAKTASPPKVSSPFSLPDKLEQLGKQMIEGVEAEGTRSTQIIPAGAMGNERPIEVTHESWYSPELQMHVLTKMSDPRSGETTQRLINLSRSEPDPSLFQLPSEYTIRELDTPNMFIMKGEADKKAREANRDSSNK